MPPYIPKGERPNIIEKIEKLISNINNAGQLNFTITKLCHEYLKKIGIRYQNLNEVIGVIECVKQELYRRVIANYEDKAIERNGDVE